MRVRTSGAGGAVVMAAALVLAGCGSGGSGGGSAASGTTTGPASSGSGSATSATAVTVTAKDFSLSLSSGHVAPGSYTLTMVNAGNATHAIEISGPGVAGQRSGTAGPGGKASVAVTLQPGTYDIWCPVGNHRAMGMETRLTVG